MIGGFKKLEAINVLNSKDRNSCVDVFRAVAILLIVLFHFHGWFAYGFIGVDVFFVISGLLVGGLLAKKASRGERVHFFRFVLQRGFKIWPSYYFFLLVGDGLAYLLYFKLYPEYVIPGSDLKRYLFFYQNYAGTSFHWVFDHIWSLCVEEHFYILLPIGVIVIMAIFKNRKFYLFLMAGFMILVGIIFKYLTAVYTQSKTIFTGTHTRLDALAWGVLLTLIVIYHPPWLKRKYIFLLSIVGLLIVVGNVCIDHYLPSDFYRKVVFHSVAPFGFFLMIAGLYYVDFSRFKVLRFIAYYSYNWYLWHVLLVPIITLYIGENIGGLAFYVAASFAVAMLFTILIEEPFLKLRQPVLNKISRLFTRDPKLSN